MPTYMARLRAPATLTNGTEYDTPAVPCRGARQIAFLARSTDGANLLSSASFQVSEEDPPSGASWRVGGANVGTNSAGVLTGLTNAGGLWLIGYPAGQGNNGQYFYFTWKWCRGAFLAAGVSITGFEVWVQIAMDDVMGGFDQKYLGSISV